MLNLFNTSAGPSRHLGPTLKAVVAAIAAPVLANQVLAAASPIFGRAVRQEMIAANPCFGVEDAEITASQLSAPLKLILL